VTNRLDDDAAVDYEANVRQPGIVDEMNRELGGQEERAINRRVKWAREQRAAGRRLCETTEADR
jgi:hypothetical protein